MSIIITVIIIIPPSFP